jgi:hypothetical protein
LWDNLEDERIIEIVNNNNNNSSQINTSYLAEILAKEAEMFSNEKYDILILENMILHLQRKLNIIINTTVVVKKMILRSSFLSYHQITHYMIINQQVLRLVKIELKFYKKFI